VRINGEDYFINRLGRYADSVALAKASTISARIWQDYCSGTLDYSLESYQPVPEETADESLVKSLRQFYFSNGQGRVRHALRLVEAYGKPLRTKQQVAAFLLWMEERGIAAQTRVGILSTFRRVKPEQPAFSGHRIKVPPRSVLNDILSRTEVTLILDYLKRNDDWYFPIFFVWLGTGLRNAELIGLTWDSVDFEQGELKITKSLRRRDDSSTVRDWSNTKNRKHRIVPLTSGVLEVLQQHQQQMIKLGLYSPDGLLFLTKRSHSNLYDAVLERVWKRTLDACGVR